MNEMEIVQNQLSRIEAKIDNLDDKMLEVIAKNAEQDSELKWVKGSVRLLFVILLSVAGFLATYSFETLTQPPKATLHEERKDEEIQD